jgi:N-acetylglucosamine-6-phosphate deacetylase
MRIVASEALTSRAIALEFDGNSVHLTPAASIPHGHLYLSPGWVDVQVNGFAGHDINAPDSRPDTVVQLVRRLWVEGVTTFCPTVVTASAEHITHCLRNIARACEAEPDARTAIIGIHLEGPYLSPAEGTRGVHPARHIHPPDWDEFSRWQAAADGLIRLVTLAPEQPGSIAFIRRLIQSGVTVAIGHSEANSSDIAAAVDAGAGLSTHLGNGIAATLRRHPNPIWDQLADDRLSASVIFDGFHLPASVMRVFVRAKGVERLILISDAVALARMAPGVYETPVGGKVALHANGLLSQYGSEYLAGSASSMKDGVENALRLAGCAPAEAARMAGVNPLRLLKSAPRDAHTLFQWDAGQSRLTVLATVIAGRAVYQAPNMPSFAQGE